jgi:Zn ribbon nucleic-acid-binding protein
MSEQIYTVDGKILGPDGNSVEWIEREISFDINDKDWECLCSFPPERSEDITSAKVRSLALLGAAVVLLHNGEIQSLPCYLPRCVPKNIQEAIKKAIPNKEKEIMPLIESCPYCQQQNVELVEAWSENFQEKGPAVECIDCGLRGMIAQQGDDRTAIEAWNEIAGLFARHSEELT